jgi:hypothetical protein
MGFRWSQVQILSPRPAEANARQSLGYRAFVHSMNTLSSNKSAGKKLCAP